jgi:hypothetical protein
MVMTGVSRKMSDLNLGQRWAARMAVSLTLGLVFLLYAKASAARETKCANDSRIETFLIGCASINEGHPFTRGTDLSSISSIEIDLPKASKSEVPQMNWKSFQVLKRLVIIGRMPEADKQGGAAQEYLSDKEMQTFGEILLLTPHAFMLDCLILQNMNIRGNLEFSKQFRKESLITSMTFNNVTCFGVTIPGETLLEKIFQKKEITTLILENFRCSNDAPSPLLIAPWTRHLSIVKSSIGNIGPGPIEGKENLSLKVLNSLQIEDVENVRTENFIRRVGMKSLKKLEMRETDLDSLEFIKNFRKEGGRLRSLESFRVKDVNARCVEPLGVKCVGDLSEVRGTWDERNEKWRVETFGDAQERKQRNTMILKWAGGLFLVGVLAVVGLVVVFKFAIPLF